MNKKTSLNNFAIVTILLSILICTSTIPIKLIADSAFQASLTDQQLWALGASALLIERNHGRHDHLSADIMTPENHESVRQLLADFWGDNNRKDLLESLAWLEQGGHRKHFDDMGQRLSFLSVDEYLHLLEYYKNDKETHHSIEVVAQYHSLLGKKNLLGWDYSRYICLCRWGYAAGYLSEEEAWQRIMVAAKILQNNFDSWQDLGQNYLIGRQFWSYEEVTEEGYIMEDAYMRLVDMPSSPWNKLPWDLDLTQKARNYSGSVED